ncbi:hypothetical protein [Xenorhabdus kozodoii]|uniref:Uncharacterized protein n=1 Tax=Xenorhabdus kozodoii TaxID=351676 RepID=A0A2D0L4I6_9GAMM|nr:hypothetical protein [Xenorhabdus kozodoii]PHM70603.1 hypothetical protein Xkoz_03043 [Xenorhabdus kozodoii]
MQPNHIFNGRLSGSPFSQKAWRADARILPLESVDDYSSLSRIPKPVFQAPVLCGFQEKYHLLEHIIFAAFNRLQPLEYCVMTAMMPGGRRLPARMLEDDIFLVHQVDAEVKRIYQAGYSLLSIEESIIRHPLEAGNNSLTLCWYAQMTEKGMQGWYEFIADLGRLNIKELDGKTGC